MSILKYIFDSVFERHPLVSASVMSVRSRHFLHSKKRGRRQEARITSVEILSMVTRIPVLPLTYQLLLQRLTAAHVLSESQFVELWDEIRESQASQTHSDESIQQIVSRINKSLKPGFGMEIRSISFRLRGSSDSLDEEGLEGKTTRSKYFAVVNSTRDDVSTALASKLTKSPHELAYIRLILEKIVESSNQELLQEQEEEKENEEENSDDERKKRRRLNRTRGIGCIASLSRMDLINLRTELTGHHQNKLTIQQSDNCLASLEAEGWLVECIKGSRRKSMGGSSNLQLGPRAYMEFPEFLVKVGLERDHLPQFILH